MRTYPAISRRPFSDEGLRRGCSSGSSGSHVAKVLLVNGDDVMGRLCS